MILITGAGGQIGSQLLAQLKSVGLPVVPLYRANGAVLRLDHDHWEADLTQTEHITALGSSGVKPEIVVHLAGYIEINLQPNPAGSGLPPLPGPENIARIYTQNVIGTANLLEFCLRTGVKHIIFSSSQTVYGMPMGEAFAEDSPLRPMEHYAGSKVCGEQILQVATSQRINVTTLRFPGVYSEDRHKGVVYNFCKSAVSSKKIEVNAQYPLPLDVIHRDDVVTALQKAIDYNGNGWSCFNISTGDPCSLSILAHSIASLVPGCEVEQHSVDQPVVQMDPSLAELVLGWKAVPRLKRLQIMLESVRNAEQTR